MKTRLLLGGTFGKGRRVHCPQRQTRNLFSRNLMAATTMAKPWFIYESVPIFRLGEDAYSYSISDSYLSADGSPYAYAPFDAGIESLAAAGYPCKGWRSILVEDPKRPGTPYKAENGFYVSRTLLRDELLPDTNSAKFVDASKIPYVTFPGSFYAIPGTGEMGDFIMARNLSTGKLSAAIVADGGPMKSPLGQISLCLAERLGGQNPNPRTGNGVPIGTIQYVVFPGSGTKPAWPKTSEEIEGAAGKLLRRLGEWPTV